MTSKKKDDVMKGILLLMRNNRLEKKEFTNEDIVYFNRFNIPDQYKKFESYLKEEPIEFVQYMFENQKEYIIKHKLEHFLEDVKARKEMRGISFSDKYQIKKYENLSQYIKVNIKEQLGK